MAGVTQSSDLTPEVDIDDTVVFYHRGLRVRGFIINGETWYAAADIGRILRMGGGKEVRSYLDSGYMTVDLNEYARDNPGRINIRHTAEGLLILVSEDAVDLLTLRSAEMRRSNEPPDWYVNPKALARGVVKVRSTPPSLPAGLADLDLFAAPPVPEEPAAPSVTTGDPEHQEEAMPRSRPIPGPPRSEPTPTVETITPVVAQALLDANISNRNFRVSIANTYARDMAAGRWRYNGDTIRIALDGRLLDGQHRLRAVVISGVPMKAIVVRGLDPTVQSTMDTGAKRRVADNLIMRGARYASTQATIARRALIWQTSNFKDLRSSHDGVSSAETLEFIETHASVEAAAEYIHHHGKLPWAPGLLGFSYWALATVDEEYAQLFFDGLITGSDLSANDPILVLRNKLMNIRTASIRAQDDRMIVALVFKAWNLSRRGKSISVLKFMSTEPFPVPK